MLLPRISMLILCSSCLVYCEKDTGETDVTSAFVEAAQALFNDKEAVGGLQGMASAFMQSGAGQQVNDLLSSSSNGGNGASQLLSGLGSLMAGAVGGGGGGRDGENPFLSTILDSFLDNKKIGSRKKREDRYDNEEMNDNEIGGGGGGGGGFDFETMANVASMFLGDNNLNAEGLMGFLPMLMQNFAGSGNTDNSNYYNGLKKNNNHDHSGHSWFLPPIIENIHIMWEHFSNSELGQTLWKNSGLANIIGTMMDSNGNLEYEKIFESFENPNLRRRWIKSLTNFVAEWISHISDPIIRQRYLTTVQFVGNGFLKSQGYPKTAMFDPSKPAESLSKFVDATAKRYLNMKINSQKYVRPAVSYFQELVNLASEKGFIVSYISANELSNKLSNTLNNDFIEPIMTVYRSYKWGVKKPECATHIFCVINDKSVKGQESLSKNVTRFASYPAAWLLSNKTGINFWTLYGAVSESDNCFAKHPVDCTDYHEEEIRIKTESVHSEL